MSFLSNSTGSIPNEAACAFKYDRAAAADSFITSPSWPVSFNSPWPGVDPDGWRDHLRRGGAHARQGRVEAHRPAGRGDEGVGGGGSVVFESARCFVGDRPSACRQ